MIYGLVLMVQKKEIERFCFGECGAVIIGAIDSEIAGPLVPCRRDDCPFEEQCTPIIGQTGIDNEELKIRKLRPIQS